VQDKLLGMKCKECNKEVSEDSSFCQHCGKKIEKKELSERLDDYYDAIKNYLMILFRFFSENPKIHKEYIKFVKKVEKNPNLNEENRELYEKMLQASKEKD